MSITLASANSKNQQSDPAAFSPSEQACTDMTAATATKAPTGRVACFLSGLAALTMLSSCVGPNGMPMSPFDPGMLGGGGPSGPAPAYAPGQPMPSGGPGYYAGPEYGAPLAPQPSNGMQYQGPGGYTVTRERGSQNLYPGGANFRRSQTRDYGSHIEDTTMRGGTGRGFSYSKGTFNPFTGVNSGYSINVDRRGQVSVGTSYDYRQPRHAEQPNVQGMYRDAQIRKAQEDARARNRAIQEAINKSIFGR